MDAVTSSSLKLFPYNFSTSSKPSMVCCMKKMKELTLEPVRCSGVGGAFVHEMQRMERPLLIRAAASEEENNQASPQITLPLIDFADVIKAASYFTRLLGAGGFGEEFYGIASRLNYLYHELEFGALLHLDIKLANVLLDANFIPKISDFGLGLLFSHRNSSPIVAKKGVVGTDTYMVPEVKFGILSSKEDVYSFGHVLFELITERVI
ncbi:uncharacterized protein LOC130743825 [Lotus japonicus]|uniref:uncharacterized protein LOC130743825 n=1 Tax=Lotus japonicus TaxID=34305 RepID=UPI00258DBD2D|nr:uncharacterized protein LOC130743825 [Lotus japonicus]